MTNFLDFVAKGGTNLNVVAIMLVEVSVAVLPVGGRYRPTFERQSDLDVLTSSDCDVFHLVQVNTRLHYILHSDNRHISLNYVTVLKYKQISCHFKILLVIVLV